MNDTLERIATALETIAECLSSSKDLKKPTTTTTNYELGEHELEAIKRAANKLRSLAPQIGRDFIWRSTVLCYKIDPSLPAAVLDKLQANEIDKPKLYVNAIIMDNYGWTSAELWQAMSAIPVPPIPEKASE